MPPKSRIPDRWEAYSKMGKVIAGTSIMPIKVPLKEYLTQSLPEEERFSPSSLLDSFNKQNLKLGGIIDLTFTTRYYDSQFFSTNDVGYAKVFTAGKVVPTNKTYTQFHKAMKELEKEGEVTCVHCTHGLNRSGYMICRYMIEALSIEPQTAIRLFEEARGYKMERENYIEDLLDRKPGVLNLDEGDEEEEESNEASTGSQSTSVESPNKHNNYNRVGYHHQQTNHNHSNGSYHDYNNYGNYGNNYSNNYYNRPHYYDNYNHYNNDRRHGGGGGHSNNNNICHSSSSRNDAVEWHNDVELNGGHGWFSGSESTAGSDWAQHNHNHHGDGNGEYWGHDSNSGGGGARRGGMGSSRGQNDLDYHNFDGHDRSYHHSRYRPYHYNTYNNSYNCDSRNEVSGFGQGYAGNRDSYNHRRGGNGRHNNSWNNNNNNDYDYSNNKRQSGEDIERHSKPEDGCSNTNTVTKDE